MTVEYTYQEICDYLKGKMEINYTDHCYIISETGQTLKLGFKEKKHGLRRWLKPVGEVGYLGGKRLCVLRRKRWKNEF